MKNIIIKNNSSIFALLISTLRSFNQKDNLSVLTGQSKKIEKYYLVKPIVKSHQFIHFDTGIYSDGVKNVFIKTWKGKTKNIYYYNLVNEYVAANLLYKKMSEIKKTIVSVPKVLSTMTTEKSFSIIYEYIQGKPLYKFNKKYQIYTITKVINTLQAISKNMSTNESKTFSKRNIYFYYLSFYPIFFLVLLQNLKYYQLLSRVFYQSLKTMPHLKSKMGVVHRDINQENIIIKDKRIYLLDVEKTVVTIPEYDSVHITVKPETYTIAKDIVHLTQDDTNKFLYNYICLHNILNYKDNIQYRTHYIKMLQNYE